MNLRTVTQNGSGFFLHRPSEVSHFSLSARAVIGPLCGVVVKDGAQPSLPVSANQEPASEPVVNGTSVTGGDPSGGTAQHRFVASCCQFVNLIKQQLYFDCVGWATGRASGL